ncbi:MAG: hypothetical protein JSV76_07455 [Candidatus Bathyarchaeota archaeon]|nr:MAG: hypothetical protein JSV76_07455 [Candidatus Bathyarchaeota archaeon]
MSIDDETPPVKVIEVENTMPLRDLLSQHNLLDQVSSGNKIVLLEGYSLTDLDYLVPSGKQLAVILIDMLGGG